MDDYVVSNYARFGKIVKKFKETGVVTNIERPVHHRFACSAENVANVSESFADDPNVLIPRRSQESGLSYSTLGHILRLDLHLHPYKIKLTQELKPTDHSQRCRYVQLVFKQQAMHGNFSNKIFFSDVLHISQSVVMLINKFVVFGVLRILN